jgi:hypothetical protein
MSKEGEKGNQARQVHGAITVYYINMVTGNWLNGKWTNNQLPITGYHLT